MPSNTLVLSVWRTPTFLSKPVNWISQIRMIRFGKPVEPSGICECWNFAVAASHSRRRSAYSSLELSSNKSFSRRIRLPFHGAELQQVILAEDPLTVPWS